MLTPGAEALCLRFEYTLAYHCAPALTGIKPADLISWPEGCCPALLAQYGPALARAGISLRCLGARGGRSLLLVYRERRLSEQLEKPEVHALLSRTGYPVQRDTELLLDALARRLEVSESFPHEVGLFLGYPVEDVLGFCRNGGQNYKFSGLWKVYSDVDRARACLSRYDRCRRGLCSRLDAGCRLCELFAARGAA